MTNMTETLSRQVVDAFREELDDALIAAIGETHFHRLEVLVAQAVSTTLQHAAEEMDSVSRTLRRESEPGARRLYL